jgi:hypothetical protein
MEEVINLIDEFEKRNNISIAVTFYSDGSSCIEEFWDNECLSDNNTVEELRFFLINTNYKKSESGRCLKPCQKING